MIGNILGLLGIIITVAFGIYSIWVYKKTKKNVSIEMKNEQCYSLFRDDVKRLNIELIYKSKTLSNALILLKAKIVNNGQIDIDKNRIFKPLKIISQKEFIWLEARPTIQPNGSTASIRLIDQNEIEINWDLLKTDEFIEFEALVEIVDGTKLYGDKTIAFYNGLTFDYRITDLNNIQKEKKIPKSNPFEIIVKYSKVFAVLIVLLGALSIATEYFPVLRFLPDKREVFLSIDNGTSQIKGYLDATNTGDLIFKVSGSDETIKLPVDEFNKKYKILSVEKTDVTFKISLINRIIGIVYIALGILLYILKTILDKKRKIEMDSKNQSQTQ